MKKASAYLIIAIFLISTLPLNLAAVSAAEEKVCCAKSEGSYCVFATRDKCDPSPVLKSQVGFITSPFACSQLSDCKPVCCISANGVCSEKISKAQCRAQGGKPIDSPNCQISECEKGACIIANQCQYPVTSSSCKTQAEKLKVKYTFDTSVKSQKECSTKYSLEEGCCVVSNSCSRTTGEQCTLQKGNFYPGKLCSNQELVSQCRDHTAQYAKTCSKDGNLYWTDSRGLLENIVGTQDDGLIHNKQTDLQGKAGFCDISKGFTCGKNQNGQYDCIDINCKVNDGIDLRGIVQYAPDIGKMFPEKHTITQEDLGGRSIRKNGESWCYSTSGEKTEPGTSNYVFSCQYGKIKVEACGEYRDKICQEEVKITQSSARCIDNRWEDCWTYGGGKDWRRNTAFYPENKVNPVKRSFLDLVPVTSFLPIGAKKDKRECLLLGGSEDESKSHCVFDKNELNECWPRYPPGFEFWKPATTDKVSAQRVCNRCGKGGNGKINSCDEKECSYMADCGFGEGWAWWGGAVVGGAIGFASGVGVNHIFSVGQGGGILGGATTPAPQLATALPESASLLSAETLTPTLVADVGTGSALGGGAATATPVIQIGTQTAGPSLTKRVLEGVIVGTAGQVASQGITRRLVPHTQPGVGQYVDAYGNPIYKDPKDYDAKYVEIESAQGKRYYPYDAK